MLPQPGVNGGDGTADFTGNSGDGIARAENPGYGLLTGFCGVVNVGHGGSKGKWMQWRRGQSNRDATIILRR